MKYTGIDILTQGTLILSYYFFSSVIDSLNIFLSRIFNKMLILLSLETEGSAPADKSTTEADWVMVEPPAADETSAVKEASTGQDQAVLETKETPVQEPTTTAEAESMETTEDTSQNKSQNKTDKADDKSKDEKAQGSSAEKNKEEPKVEELV